MSNQPRFFTRSARGSVARLAVLAAALAAGALLPACVTYSPRYAPMPAAVEAQGTRTLISVLGAQPGEAGAADTMHLRLHFESPVGKTTRLLPESLKLLSADLRAFGPAQVLGGGALQAEGGAVAEVELAFPFPDGDYDLRTLTLNWVLQVGSDTLRLSATFQRITTSYYGSYDPWYDPWCDPWYGPWYGPWHDPWHGEVHGEVHGDVHGDVKAGVGASATSH